MTTSISFTNDGGTPVPSVSSVPVVNGDSIKLSVSVGKATLYFSPALAAILTPAPGPSIVLESANAPEFTFTSSAVGAYSLVAAAEGHPAPHFSTAPSAHLLISSAMSAPRVAASFPITGGTTGTNN